MPRISVVVPIYNVEEFLEPCLESLAAQSAGDFEAVLVDDGSTDSSGALAKAFARRDARFRVITQPNGGLSKARNTGLDATRSEFLHFLDSDDLLPPDAHELLLGALDETGSDFATGNVHRLTRRGTAQTPFLRHTFAERRLRTHISRDRPLLADRTAWNKLFRRSFWDAQGLRFPEGRVHEDIPVILPLHFRAKAVDVVPEPVYLYRIREGGDLSITQRRLEPKVLMDRLQAIEEVADFLNAEGPKAARRWYAESIVEDDLRYYVNALDGADDDYRALFLDRVNAVLDKVDDQAFEPLRAIERLKWHLVRRRLMPELLEVLRFQREDLKETPPVLVGGRAYGDYPYRTDPALKVPAGVYRLRDELMLRPRVDALWLEGEQLRLRGWAFIDGVGAPERDSQKLSLVALRRGPLRRVRYVLAPLRLRLTATRRPEATAEDAELSDATWSGFDATLDLGALRRRAGRRSPLQRGTPGGTWDVFATVKAGRELRRRMKWRTDGPQPVLAVELPGRDGPLVRAGVTEAGELAIEVLADRAELTSHRAQDDDLVLAGRVTGPVTGKVVLEARRADASARRRAPVEVAADGTWEARLPLARLLEAPAAPVRRETDPDAAEQEREAARDDDEPAPTAADADEDAGGDETEQAERSEAATSGGDAEEAAEPWELFLESKGRRRRVALPASVEAGTWPAGDGREVALRRTTQGDAALEDRRRAAVLETATWSDGGVLELAGRWPSVAGGEELVLQPGRRSEQRVVGVELGPDGRFSARLEPGAMPTLGGDLPLPEGWWGLYTHPPGDHHDDQLTPVAVAADLQARLPLEGAAAGKVFHLTVRPRGGAAVVAGRDLAVDERGRFNQLRLRREVYLGRRHEPLRDAVVYSSFRGRQFSDSPRMIHEELVRRGAPLEHLWIVKDGQAAVPDSATVLRDGSRESFEALATARYVVVNDHFPNWFHRRDDQVGLQTWHGTPLKRLGLDVSQTRQTIRRFQHRWAQQVANWQFVVSPNPFTTPILRRAYAIEGRLLETGYPRNDVLAADGREARTAAVRARLGLPEGKRIVLYAPTYRDHVVDGKGRHRLDLHLDVERLRDVVGGDTVVLFRKHHYVVDAAPATPDGFVRDVSHYPDGTELLLAADVLITDYSSMMFDFANTGRPMLFFTYDLEAYRDQIRGFYFDFLDTAPGPLLQTSDDVALALRDHEEVQRAHANRYAAFAERFCALDDGHAAARVVDEVFGA